MLAGHGRGAAGRGLRSAVSLVNALGMCSCTHQTLCAAEAVARTRGHGARSRVARLTERRGLGVSDDALASPADGLDVAPRPPALGPAARRRSWVPWANSQAGGGGRAAGHPLISGIVGPWRRRGCASGLRRGGRFLEGGCAWRPRARICPRCAAVWTGEDASPRT